MEGYINIKKRISTFLTTKPTGRIITSILGILILLGGLGTGVILVKQQQLFEQKAASDCDDCYYECRDWPNQSNCHAYCDAYDARCKSGNPTPTPGGGGNPTPTPGGGGGSGTCDPPSVANCQGQSVGYKFCFLGWKMKCVNAGYGTCGQDYTTDPPTSCGGGDPTPTPGEKGAGCHFDGSVGACRGQCPEGKYCGYGPQNPSCYCVDTDSGSTGESVTGTYTVTAYNTSWQNLDQNQLSVLKAGDKIRFAVSGSSTAQIDKAKFIINGEQTAEVTQRRPGTGEYYYEYTLPVNVTSFTVNAQLHTVNSGWF